MCKNIICILKSCFCNKIGYCLWKVKQKCKRNMPDSKIHNKNEWDSCSILQLQIFHHDSKHHPKIAKKSSSHDWKFGESQGTCVYSCPSLQTLVYQPGCGLIYVLWPISMILLVNPKDQLSFITSQWSINHVWFDKITTITTHHVLSPLYPGKISLYGFVWPTDWCTTGHSSCDRWRPWTADAS